MEPNKHSTSIMRNLYERVNNKFNKIMIYLLISCSTEKRIVQNIYIHNSNKNYRRIKLSKYNRNNYKQQYQPRSGWDIRTVFFFLVLSQPS